MADNVTIPASGTGDATPKVATDQLASGEHVQFVKIMDGALDSSTKVGATANGLKVDGSAVTQPVSGTVGVSGTVPVSGTVTANAGTGPWPVTDNAGSLTVDAPVGTPVWVRLSDGAAAFVGQKAMAASVPVAIASDQSAVPVSGTVTANQGGAPWSENVTQLGGNAINLGAGNAGTGTPRVILATDQPQLTNALKVDGSAVTQPVSGTVTANPTDRTASGSLSAPGNTIAISTVGSSVVVFTVTGPYTGSLIPEGTLDGVTWFTWEVYPINTGLPAQGMTTTGQWNIPVAGLQQFRLRANVMSAGAAAVQMIAGAGAASQPFVFTVAPQDAIANGAVTPVSVTQPSVYNGLGWDRNREMPSADGQARTGIPAMGLMGLNPQGTYDRIAGTAAAGLEVTSQGTDGITAGLQEFQQNLRGHNALTVRDENLSGKLDQVITLLTDLCFAMGLLAAETRGGTQTVRSDGLAGYYERTNLNAC